MWCIYYCLSIPLLESTKHSARAHNCNWSVLTTDLTVCGNFHILNDQEALHPWTTTEIHKSQNDLISNYIAQYPKWKVVQKIWYIQAKKWLKHEQNWAWPNWQQLYNFMKEVSGKQTKVIHKSGNEQLWYLQSGNMVGIGLLGQWHKLSVV